MFVTLLGMIKSEILVKFVHSRNVSVKFITLLGIVKPDISVIPVQWENK